jgi:hypothetical protein
LIDDIAPDRLRHHDRGERRWIGYLGDGRALTFVSSTSAEDEQGSEHTSRMDDLFHELSLIDSKQPRGRRIGPASGHATNPGARDL